MTSMSKNQHPVDSEYTDVASQPGNLSIYIMLLHTLIILKTFYLVSCNY